MNVAPPQVKPHLDFSAIALMVFLTAVWGLHHSVVKVGLLGISPVYQAGFRSIIAALLVWAWMVFRRQPLFDKDGTLWPGILAGILFAGEFFFIYGSLSLTSAGRAIVFLHLYPFLVAIGAHFWVPGERMKLIHVVGLIAAILGLSIAFLDGVMVFERDQIIGDIFALIGGAFWAGTTLIIKKTSLIRAPAAKTLLYQLVVSGALLPLAAFAVGEKGIFDLSPLVVVAFLYQTVVVCFASFLVWFWLVTRYPAGRLSSFNFLSPLFGILFGYLMWGEELLPSLALAVILVGMGIWMINRR
jgi:drug/metabolite transporter (DMT)-like permease